jgi:hypothetical protein
VEAAIRALVYHGPGQKAWEEVQGVIAVRDRLSYPGEYSVVAGPVF